MSDLNAGDVTDEPLAAVISDYFAAVDRMVDEIPDCEIEERLNRLLRGQGCNTTDWKT